MASLESDKYLVGLQKEEFTDRISHYYCEINMLHPFMSGNGVAQRIFFEQLAIHAGYVLNWQDRPGRLGCRQPERGDGRFDRPERHLRQSCERSAGICVK